MKMVNSKVQGVGNTINENRSVYIHIPFCKTICSYCDFCKVFYYEKWADLYLDELEEEIKKKYQGDKVKSIYIGGGTPNSLSISQLEKLFSILSVFKGEDLEYTIECNIELLTEEQLVLFKKNGINRISIGIETFDEEILNFLNRRYKKDEVIDKINICKTYISNINIDLIYALPNQKIIDLENDLRIYLELDVPHISIYSLIIEPHTKLYNEGFEYIDDELDYEMYKIINKYLKDYHHYEISNFAKPGYESRHNLTYWNNDEYYGFGLGASGYVDNVRYENTKNINKYLNGNYVQESHVLSFNENIENAFILGFRKINGINKERFLKKYGIDIKNNIVINLIEERKLIDDGNYIFINPKYIYTENDILINFIGGNYEK